MYKIHDKNASPLGVPGWGASLGTWPGGGFERNNRPTPNTNDDANDVTTFPSVVKINKILL